MSNELNVNLIPERTHVEEMQLNQINLVQDVINMAMSISENAGGGETEETKSIRKRSNNIMDQLKKPLEQKQPPKNNFKVGGIAGETKQCSPYVFKGESVINRK